MNFETGIEDYLLLRLFDTISPISKHDLLVSYFVIVQTEICVLVKKKLNAEIRIIALIPCQSC